MMNMTMISIAAIAVLWFLSLLLGLIRGSKKSLSRFIVVLVCAAIAFGTTLVFKNNLPEFYQQFSGEIQNALKDNTEIFELIENAETCRNAILSFAGSLVAPILFVAIFLLLQILTWVLGFVFGILIGFIRLAVGKRNKAPHRPFRAMLLATIQFVLVMMVILTPIACYLGIVTDNMEAVKSSGLLPADVANQAEELGVAEIGNSPVFSVYRTIGGKTITKSLTTIKVGDEKTTLAVELKSVLGIAADASQLMNKGIANFTEEDADKIAALISFGDSKLVPAIVGEALFQATDVWTQEVEEGQEAPKFMGVAKPTVGETLDPAFNTLLTIFHEDSQNTAYLTEDFTTLGEMVSVLVKNGLTSNLNDTNAMIDKLTTGNAVSDLVTALGSNNRLKKLIPEITNIAMRAIGSALKIPADNGVIYDGCMGDIASAINAAKQNGDLNAQIEALTPEIKAALDDSGIEIGVDESVLKLFATTFIDEFSEKDTVTADDVAAFFAAYGNAMTEPDATAAVNPLFENLAATEKLANTNSGAQKLATLTKKIANAASTAADDVAFKAAVEQAMNETFTDSKYEAVISAVKNDIKKESVKEDGFKALADLKSPETMTTVLVTMNDLLVNVEAAAANLSSSEAVANEAASISKIMSKAGAIINDTSSLNDISKAAGTVGDVLDALKDSPSFGSDQTAKLVTAVFQSDMVANDSMKMNKFEATKLAQEATKKSADGTDVSYADTLNGVSSGLDVVTKISESGNNITEEDIKELLEAMTPNLAGMLKTYITADKLASFGLSGNNLELATTVLQNLFDEMAKEGQDFDKEKKGIANLFNLVSGATKNTSSSEKLFGTSGDNSLFHKSADEILTELLDSNILCNTMTKTLTENGQVKPEYQNPFNIQMTSDSEDYTAISGALNAKYASATDETQKLRVETLAALFGITITK